MPSAPISPWRQAAGEVGAVAGIEGRNLLRNPAAHLPLRGPAGLLLIVFFGWIAPNRGDDAIANLADLSGMGVLLYGALWQMQLLCNRFGNDAGAAALLLGFPVPRSRLLLGKNLALLGLLLIVDGALAVLLGLLARAPAHLIPPMLAWMGAALVVLTALGNVVSVLNPFPIPQRGERFRYEPERSLAFLYVLLGLGTWGLLLPVARFLGAARAAGGPVATVFALLLSAALLTALYAASVWLSARLLRRPWRERRLIRRLDGR